MRFKKMMKDMKQHEQMALVAATLGLANIVHDHVSNVCTSMVLGQKVVSKCRSSYFGNVFVFGDREHLFFGQPAESDAVLKGNHVAVTPGTPPSTDE
jgi:hypothetical protein